MADENVFYWECRGCGVQLKCFVESSDGIEVQCPECHHYNSIPSTKIKPIFKKWLQAEEQRRELKAIEDDEKEEIRERQREEMRKIQKRGRQRLHLEKMRQRKEQGAVEAESAPGMKKCPECAEIIKTEANRCRYCGTQFAMAESAEVV